MKRVIVVALSWFISSTPMEHGMQFNAAQHICRSYVGGGQYMLSEISKGNDHGCYYHAYCIRYCKQYSQESLDTAQQGEPVYYVMNTQPIHQKAFTFLSEKSNTCAWLDKSGCIRIARVIPEGILEENTLALDGVHKIGTIAPELRVRGMKLVIKWNDGTISSTSIESDEE